MVTEKDRPRIKGGALTCRNVKVTQTEKAGL
jgi:hypothetical protein